MAGAGYKLFNTGDVLLASEVNTYLMQQTVMVFANSTARTSALSGVLAEGMISYLADTNATEVYDGSSWVSVSGTGDITAVTTGANSGLAGGVTTGNADIKINFASKGQLAVGTGSGTTDFLTVGTNGHTLVADSSTSTGLKWAAASASGFVGCQLTNSTYITCSNNTSTTITFDTEKFDTDGFHSTTTNTGRITIPSGKDGKYLFTAKIVFQGNNTGIRYASLKKNGSTQYRMVTIQTVTSGNPDVCAFTISQVFDLVATDYMELVCLQTSGGNLDVLGLTNGAQEEVYFTAQFLGA